MVHQGATPVFPDVDPVTGLITAKHLEEVITSRTRAIIAVVVAPSRQVTISHRFTYSRLTRPDRSSRWTPAHSAEVALLPPLYAGYVQQQMNDTACIRRQKEWLTH